MLSEIYFKIVPGEKKNRSEGDMKMNSKMLVKSGDRCVSSLFCFCKCI